MTSEGYRRAEFLTLGLSCVAALVSMVGGARWPLWWALGGVTLAMAYFIAAKWRYGYLLVYGLIGVAAVGILVARLLGIMP
jgi:hypothetical protein